MICPLSGECQSCPYWPHCKIAADEMWNSFPERRRSFLEAIEEDSPTIGS